MMIKQLSHINSCNTLSGDHTVCKKVSLKPFCLRVLLLVWVLFAPELNDFYEPKMGLPIWVVGQEYCHAWSIHSALKGNPGWHKQFAEKGNIC